MNHVRTLLLNLASAGGYSCPGEEYVPPGYGPRALPQPLLAARRALFGHDPDRALLNYRLRQYLCLLHVGDLEGFVTAKDPRVTYWPFDDSVLRLAGFGPVVRQVGGAAVQALRVLRPGAAVEVGGHLQKQWQVEVTNGSTVTVRSYGDGGLSTSTAQPYTLTDGLSNVLVLPGSGVQYRFEGGVGGAWQVDLLGHPALSLAAVAAGAEALLQGAVYDALFGSDAAEPYRTFRGLWERHDETPYRLGAAALALAYRTDEVV